MKIPKFSILCCDWGEGSFVISHPFMTLPPFSDIFVSKGDVLLWKVRHALRVCILICIAGAMWGHLGNSLEAHIYTTLNTYVAVPVHSTPSGHLGNTVHTHTWTTFEQPF